MDDTEDSSEIHAPQVVDRSSRLDDSIERVTRFHDRRIARVNT
jgi:hypothetical protein